MAGFAGEDDYTGFEEDSSEEESTEEVSKSLYVSPESFDDETLFQACQMLHNDDIVFMSGDIPEDHTFAEEEAQAILANYKQVREFLHKKALNRGFFKSKPPDRKKPGTGGKGKGKGRKKFQKRKHGNKPPKPVTKKHIIENEIW